MTESARDNRSKWSRLSLAFMVAGVTALAAAAVLFVLTATGVLDESPGYSGPETITGFGSLDLASLEPELNVSLTEPPPPPSNAPIERILLPSVGIDAPISVKGIDSNGVMEVPDGPWDVSWYDFSARPGSGSNAVFSGHLDYYDIGAAVFWRLRELIESDLIQVRLSDGVVYDYQVIAMENVDAATADIGTIVGATEQEVITLITCAGTFDASTGQYDKRLIVRAERVTGHQPPPNLASLR